MTQSIPIYVVNLARASQRRADLSARLEEIGLNAQFPPALDAQEVSDAELHDGFKKWGPWGAIPLGDIACSQSHRRLWQLFLDSGAEHALILEDDVKISDALAQFCSNSDWWPTDVDIVKVERWKSNRMKVVLGLATASHNEVDLHPLLSRHPGAAAYFLNRRAAEHLLAVRPQTVAVDHLLFNRLTLTLPKGLRVVQANPVLATQRNDGVEQMPPSIRPEVPSGKLWQQRISRGLRELVFDFGSLLMVCVGRAKILRLDLSPGLERAE